MKEDDFLCRKCGYRGPTERFGEMVQCPQCGSRDVVLAEAWERFGTGNPKQTAVKPRKRRKET